MNKTGFYCIYELKDVTALNRASETTENNQDFADISLIKKKIEPSKYATLEKDFFILDGTLEEMPDDANNIVFFTNEISNENGTFEDNPTINIEFEENHTSIGLTLYFQEDYPLEMVITWYDIYGIQISKRTFHANDLKYFARNQVENYARIQITFTKAKPYRYVKLYYIEYGTDLIMGSNGMPVEDASMIEETDIISDKIAIDKLSYKLIDTEDDFNVGNIAGLHKVMQKRQKVKAYEKINDETIELGTFFLDDFKTSKNITSISAIDYKGLLDDYIFREGKVYNGELAGNVLDAIMMAAGIEDYEIDKNVREMPLYGWLKIQTCRKAIREVMFACGAVIDTARKNNIRIYRPERKVQTQIERTRKFSTKVSSKEYISDVAVKYTDYYLEEEKKEIIKGTYEKGTYEVEMSSPAADMEINVGSIIEQSNNYVIFQVEDKQEVIISGKKYSKNDYTVNASVQNTEAGKIRKTKSFSCSVLNATGAKQKAEEILNYYSLQIGLNIEYLNNGEAPGMWGEVQNSNKAYGNYLAGIEKMTTDLTGGFISKADLRGYYKLVSDFYYTGELIAGEEVGEL